MDFRFKIPTNVSYLNTSKSYKPRCQPVHQILYLEVFPTEESQILKEIFVRFGKRNNLTYTDLDEVFIIERFVLFFN